MFSVVNLSKPYKTFQCTFSEETEWNRRVFIFSMVLKSSSKSLSSPIKTEVLQSTIRYEIRGILTGNGSMKYENITNLSQRLIQKTKQYMRSRTSLKIYLVQYNFHTNYQGNLMACIPCKSTKSLKEIACQMEQQASCLLLKSYPSQEQGFTRRKKERLSQPLGTINLYPVAFKNRIK